MTPCKRFPLPRILGLLLVSALLISGCGTVAPKVTRFYTLDALATPQNAATGRPIAVEVVALRLPQYLERPQIVTREGGTRLYLSEFNQWGGNLQKDLMRTMALNFSLLLATPQVSITPYHPPTPPDYRVEVEIMRFEKDTESGEVTLLAQWRLMKKDRKEAVVTRMTTLAARPSGSAGEYEGTVATMSRLWGDLSTIIAETIRQDGQRR
jgi:uncharacterized lipoprotein YmbA